MASLKRGSHEEEQIYGSTDGWHVARGGPYLSRCGRQGPWCQRFGGMDSNDVKRLRQLEQENARLKKLVDERDLEI
jgi:hypothetical protein